MGNDESFSIKIVNEVDMSYSIGRNALKIYDVSREPQGVLLLKLDLRI